MIKTVLCARDPQALMRYQSILAGLGERYGIPQKTVCFTSGAQLLFHLSEWPDSVDLIYLELLRDMDGLKTAERLRDLGCSAEIICLCDTVAAVLDSFEVSPFYCMLKQDVPSKRFTHVFLRAVRAVEHRAKSCLLIQAGNTTERLPLSGAVYFEVQNRVISVHLADGRVRTYYDKLSSLERRLAGRAFIRVHRSYLVNCAYVQQMARTQVLLMDGTVLPVGEKYAKSACEKLIGCCGTLG